MRHSDNELHQFDCLRKRKGPRAGLQIFGEHRAIGRRFPLHSHFPAGRGVVDRVPRKVAEGARQFRLGTRINNAQQDAQAKIKGQ